jgi:hypothetical protein
VVQRHRSDVAARAHDAVYSTYAMSDEAMTLQSMAARTS